jgi:hypothetical protein
MTPAALLATLRVATPDRERSLCTGYVRIAGSYLRGAILLRFLLEISFPAPTSRG